MVPAFSLIIPAFNEGHRIGDTLVQASSYLSAASPGSEIIVVDDGSSDDTAGVVRGVFESARELETRLIQHSPNRGKGAAVRDGLRAAARPIALFSDADLSTPIDEASKLIEPISVGQVDVAFGSRALDRRLIGTRQSWGREQGGRVFNLLVRVSTGLPFWDTQCGFKAFRLDTFRPVLAKAHSEGFGFDVELLYLAHKAGLRMREIPVRWNHHEGSKVHFIHDSLHMLQEVVAMRLRG
ncbi:MAG TPA: dolichyl-phosphate beta-glucosyltransferase [Chthoniobacterales bacterium]|nr:dolichyl-phosphate beta-glucosyltransferase [Chthoniobacterales bacterium]